MLLILFGLPGVGKNYVGRILRNHFNFYFYDADEDLTAEMIAAVRNKQLFTQPMRNEYFILVSEKITNLLKKYKNVVVTQALGKELNRIQLANEFPNSTFVHIIADDEHVNARLLKRNDWVDIDYMKQIKNIFEPAQLAHETLENNHGKEQVIQQLHLLLRKHGSDFE